VKQERFDPFSARFARDIRNSLSKGFLQSVRQLNPVSYLEIAENLLNQQLALPYRNYIKNRLDGYDKAIEIINKKNIDEIVEQAEVLWNLQLYYEMHEILEDLWGKSTGTRRRALQGLIRAAGMKIHAEHGRDKAAQSIAKKAFLDLSANKTALPEFPNLDRVIEEVRKVAAIADNI
jgi:hypothetical protein